MEQRVARLEANFENLHANLQRVETKVDKLDTKVDIVKDSVVALTLQMEKSFAQLNVGRVLDRVWSLLTSAALLGVMARGFGWL